MFISIYFFVEFLNVKVYVLKIKIKCELVLIFDIVKLFKREIIKYMYFVICFD